jgi:hypothetical protein
LSVVCSFWWWSFEVAGLAGESWVDAVLVLGGGGERWVSAWWVSLLACLKDLVNGLVGHGSVWPTAASRLCVFGSAAFFVKADAALAQRGKVHPQAGLDHT